MVMVTLRIVKRNKEPLDREIKLISAKPTD